MIVEGLRVDDEEQTVLKHANAGVIKPTADAQGNLQGSRPIPGGEEDIPILCDFRQLRVLQDEGACGGIAPENAILLGEKCRLSD